MGNNQNLNYEQMSVFGSPDEEAAVIGRSTASNRQAWSEKILGPRAENQGRGIMDSRIHRSLREDNWTQNDYHAFDHKPLLASTSSSGGGDAGMYLDGVINLSAGASRHTVAHELGHHLQLAHRRDGGRWDHGGMRNNPYHEGVADGIADRVAGPGHSTYEEYHKEDWTGNSGRPDSRPDESYRKIRSMAAEGQFPEDPSHTEFRKRIQAGNYEQQSLF